MCVACCDSWGHKELDTTELIWCVCVYMRETFLSVTGNLLTVLTFDEYSWESMEPWAFSLKFQAHLCCFNR